MSDDKFVKNALFWSEDESTFLGRVVSALADKPVATGMVRPSAEGEGQAYVSQEYLAQVVKSARGFIKDEKKRQKWDGYYRLCLDFVRHVLKEITPGITDEILYTGPYGCANEAYQASIKYKRIHMGDWQNMPSGAIVHWKIGALPCEDGGSFGHIAICSESILESKQWGAKVITSCWADLTGGIQEVSLDHINKLLGKAKGWTIPEPGWTIR